MIIFRTSKLQKTCSNLKKCEKEWGTERCKKIRQRLDELHAATFLEVMRNLPGRCHELREDRAGQLSLDLDGPYRLIFEPADDQIPLKDDGGLDWGRIRKVRIIGVEDTHE